MNKSLKLKTYTGEELRKLIPALGTIIRPLPYKGRYLASCSHYLGDCSVCPLNFEPDLCDSIHVNESEDTEIHVDSRNKLFPCNFIKQHPEYFI